MSPWSLISWGSIWLVILITSVSFIKNPAGKIGVILIFSLLLKFRPGFDAENIAFAASSMIGAISFEKLPFDKRVNLVSSNIIGLILLLLFINFVL